MSNVTGQVSPQNNVTSTIELLPDVDMFLTVYTTIVFVFGLVANLIIVIAMPLAKMPGNTKTLLWTLSVVEIGALVHVTLIDRTLTGLVPHVIGSAFEVINMSNLACKVEFFFDDFYELASQWMLVAISGERCYVVYFPFRAAGLTMRKAAISSLLIIVVCAIATAPHFIYYNLNAESICGVFTDPPQVGKLYFMMRHLLVEHLTPAVIIVIMNCLIMAALIKQQREKKHMVQAKAKTGSSKSPLKITIALVIVSSIHAVLFIQCGIMCFYWAINSDMPNAPVLWQGVLMAGAIFSTSHSISFLVYYSTIDSFKSVITSCCGLSAKK